MDFILSDSLSTLFGDILLLIILFLMLMEKMQELSVIKVISTFKEPLFKRLMLNALVDTILLIEFNQEKIISEIWLELQLENTDCNFFVI